MRPSGARVRKSAVDGGYWPARSTERLGRTHPTVGGEALGAIADVRTELESAARTTIPRALHINDRDALLELIRPLCRADLETAVDDPAWPLGVVARHAPEFAFDLVAGRFSEWDFRVLSANARSRPSSVNSPTATRRAPNASSSR